MAADQGITGRFITFLAWAKIAASPTAIGAVIGGLLWLAFPGSGLGLVGLGVVLLGRVTGVCWAERLRRKGKLIEFLAREIATPELDRPRGGDEQEKD